MNKKEKQIQALERAIKAGDECYYAFNNLACETNVNFRFYSIDLYEAIKLCKIWLENIKKEGE